METFVETHPPYSIALDGYVSGPPAFVRRNSRGEGPYLNQNHHEGVARFETRATCAQVLINIREGLFNCFQSESGIRQANIYVNDCDHDVCLSAWLLRNAYMASSIMNPRLNKLVHMTDMQDSTAGAFAYPKDLPALAELLWVYQPYEVFRAGGGLEQRDEVAFRSIIEDVGQRISSYVVGISGQVELDTNYEVELSLPGWVLVREIGTNARIGMYSDGIDAFVSVRPKGDEMFVYSIGRRSMFIDFPVPEIIDALNKAEGCTDDCWGGSLTIGGSPRVKGSGLNPTEVAAIIEKVRGN